MTHNRRSFIRNASTLALVGPSMGTLHGIDKPFESIQNVEDTSETFTLNILQTTDIHCQIHAHDEMYWENNAPSFRKSGGYARIATFFKQQRAAFPHTFVFDTGDMFQGSALSVMTMGEAISPILNALDYDLYLPGNWEVVYGKKKMQKLLGNLKGPKVCANMYHDMGQGQKGELIFPPYYIWRIHGLKIGFLGYTDHLVPRRQSPAYSKGIIYTKPEDNVGHYVSVLKEQEACDFIIIVAHMGLSQQIHLANNPDCAGVQYICGGDTHERVRTPIQCTYAKVVEPGAFGSFVGQLQLKVKGGKIVEDKYQLIEMDALSVEEDPQIKTLISEIELPQKDKINRIVGYSTIPLYRYFVIENTIDTMIVDALRWGMPDIDIVLSNGFRFCPPLVSQDASGLIPITYGYIYDMLPVDSVIRFGKVKGHQILAWLEKELNNVFAAEASQRFGGWLIKFDGMRIAFDALGAEGERIHSVEIGQKPLDKEKYYSLCACERDGDPEDMICRMKGIIDVGKTTFSIHQNLIQYLAANSPVSPIPKNHAHALDVPSTLLTQVRGVDYAFY